MDDDARRRGAEASEAAMRGLASAVGDGLGVKIELGLPPGVPTYSSDPHDPRLIVRELNGKRSVGVVRDGVFVAIERRDGVFCTPRPPR